MAAITAAVIGGVAAVGSAVIGSRGARKAGGTQKRAAQRAIDEQQRQFDLTREDFAGILERGELAGEEEAAFLGLRGVEAEQEALSRFGESPGQAFLRERQERALLRNEAAIGGLGGGNVRTALQEQAFGIASTALGERKDRLSQVASRGAGATGTVAQLGQRTAENVGNIGILSGAQQAANTLALTSARQSGLRNIAGAFTGSGNIFARPGTVRTGSNPGTPSDRRLKRNIKRIGTVNGYPWYSFEYIWGEHSQGVMSDEVPPEFVTQVGGFDVVDYGALL